MNNKQFKKFAAKYPVAVILAAVIIAVTYIFGKEDLTVTEGEIEVHFIDVGQGDAALILTDSGAVLIDAGTTESGQTVASYVSTRTDTIDYMIMSHPHEDHIGGAGDVLDAVNVKNVIMPDRTADSACFDRLLDGIEQSGATVIEAVAGNGYSVGELGLEILSPDANEDYEDTNNVSAVVRVTFGSTSFMFTGDAEAVVEKDLVESARLLDCDVLKVGHHGSSTSSTEDFVKAVSPDIAVISCGKDNSYGHPHWEVMEILDEYNAEVYRTDRLGNIVITSDGTHVKVK